MNRFTDKAVLLTGAASGMGRATAIRLTGEGARVYPLFGYGEPEDIAATIAFAASQDGRFWAGSELRIDGGAYI